MKKFEFKLERLLEIRKKKEDQEMIELSKASGAYQLEVNKKDKMLTNLSGLRKDLAKDKAKLDLLRLQSYDRLSQNTDKALVKLEKVIEDKRQVMQTHIDKYSSLKKDRRAVEILKEKALKRHEEESNKEEQQETDEIGKNLFLKNKESRLNSENQ